MRYRPLDDNGDYTLNVPFYLNSPIAVAQAAYTRLLLWQGEWFADLSDGTPYLQNVLGKTTGLNPDVYVKQRILLTPGVTSLVSYSSTFDGVSRKLSITAVIDTLYGQAALSAAL